MKKKKKGKQGKEFTDLFQKCLFIFLTSIHIIYIHYHDIFCSSIVLKYRFLKQSVFVEKL